jgi:hypothetical protein
MDYVLLYAHGLKFTKVDNLIFDHSGASKDGDQFEAMLAFWKHEECIATKSVNEFITCYSFPSSSHENLSREWLSEDVYYARELLGH